MLNYVHKIMVTLIMLVGVLEILVYCKSILLFCSEYLSIVDLTQDSAGEGAGQSSTTTCILGTHL